MRISANFPTRGSEFAGTPEITFAGSLGEMLSKVEAVGSYVAKQELLAFLR